MKRYKSTVTSLSLGLATILTGCMSMPNASNPTLSLRSASVSDETAQLDLRLSNPSGTTVEVDSITWQLTYGPLPVAEGVWHGPYALESGRFLNLSKTVPFETPPLDPDASSIELSGSLILSAPEKDKMALNSGSFVTRVPIIPQPGR